MIRADDGTISMINVFTVEPERQQKLAEVLSEGAEKYIRHRPGCLSVNILPSNDDKRLIYFAQWRSKADIKATVSDPDCQAYRDKAAELADPDAHAYTVFAVHRRSAEGSRVLLEADRRELGRRRIRGDGDNGPGARRA